MAVNRRRSTTTAYSTNGSAAYAPAYDGNALRTPRRAPQPKKPVRRHERARVEVRQAGQVAPFAVVGFLAVALFAVMLITSYAQLTVVNDEMVTLRQELSELQGRNTALTAQYEKVFDLKTIQEAVGDTMLRPTSEQVVYIDLSEPDTVVVFETSGIEGGLRSLRQGLERVVDGIVEYFR